LLGAKPVIDEDTDDNFHHTVYLVGTNTLIGLHQHMKPAPPRRSASSGSAWTTWRSGVPTGPSSRSGATRLDELGIEHREISDEHYGSEVSFRDPDGIALEVFAPPAA
jgi:hypothetical protein